MNFFRNEAKSHQSGQVTVLAALALSIFLIGALAFAVDLSNMWFNRQTAQTAADAACTAGVMDLLSATTNGVTTGGFPKPAGTAIASGGYYLTTHDCSATADRSSSLCQYAILNGFNSSNASGSTALGNNVSFDFPDSSYASTLGVTAPTGAAAPVPYLRVSVQDNLPTFFAGMLKGRNGQGIKAYAVCGLQSLTSPIPIIVLHPTLASSLTIQGGGGSQNIQIIGGPKQSIQVNSCSSTSSGGSGGCQTSDPASLGGSATVNLCQAGPGFCGANMGVYGKEAQPGSTKFVQDCSSNTLCTGTQRTPAWASPEPPISDPFQLTAAPSDFTSGTSPYLPTDLCGPTGTYPNGNPCSCTESGGVTGTFNGAACTNSSNGSGTACTSADIASGNCFLDYKAHGCPVQSDIVPTKPQGKNFADGCVLYTPGHYSTGILVKNQVAVFDPGSYWVESVNISCGGGGKKWVALCLDSNSFVRPSLYSVTGTTPMYVDATGASVSNSWWDYYNTVGGATSGPVDGGTFFYFHGPGSVSVASNSGQVSGGSNNPDAFGNNAWQQGGAKASQLATCPNNGTVPNPSLPDSIGGNILLAPCSLSGTWGDPAVGSFPYTTASKYATDRGILFFQDRGATDNATPSAPVQASWGGGGAFLLAGTMYFHQCHQGGGTDSGTGCATATGATQAFNVQFTLGGNSGSNTYVLGEIIADQLNIGGTGSIGMHLNPSTAFTILKASLLQ